MSETTKHTPGPWVLVVVPGEGLKVNDASGRMVCATFGDEFEDFQGLARLVTSANAAPDLLDALRRIESQTHCEYSRDEAHAAIAKAGGEG